VCTAGDRRVAVLRFMSLLLRNVSVLAEEITSVYKARKHTAFSIYRESPNLPFTEIISSIDSPSQTPRTSTRFIDWHRFLSISGFVLVSFSLFLLLF